VTYVPFEGKKTLKISKSGDDKEVFERLFDRLGFENEIDLVALCAAIALSSKKGGEDLPRKRLSSTEKLAGLDAFDHKTLYDHIVLDYMRVGTERLEEFHQLYYQGFNILKAWLKECDKESRNELERWCLLWARYGAE
jgi:hypothetical protein